MISPDTAGSEQPADNTPIFVLGCPRSGTTLLSRILNNHPRIGIPFESQFFPNFYRQIQAYGDLNRPERMMRLLKHMLSSERVRTDWGIIMDESEIFPLVQRNDFGGAFQAIMSAWAKKTNKPRWGEKTPQNAHYGDALVHFFPAAKYLHIVRDGRDIALSLDKTPFGPKSSYHAAQYWLLYLKEIETIERKIDNSSQFHTLRYEELLAWPRETLVKLCAFLHEKYDPAMLSFFQADISSNIEPTNRENLQKPLDAANRLKWKKEMSLDDRSVFESIAGNKLALLGYEQMDRPTSIPKFAYVKDRYIKPWPQRLRGMFKNFKAQREFLFRLKNRIDLLIH